MLIIHLQILDTINSTSTVGYKINFTSDHIQFHLQSEYHQLKFICFFFSLLIANDCKILYLI